MTRPMLHYRKYFICLGVAAITAAWLFLLLYGLGLRPPHHDEGINGWHVMQMWRQGFFRYDPNNYHGPLFFYLLQLSEILHGKNIISYRLVTVLFAVANTLLALAHRRFFGRIAVWAALALAFSPAALFYGRYAIHETVFIFFQLAFSYGFFIYLYRLSWRSGVIWMIVGFFGTFLIKETFFIFFGTWLIALLLVTAASRFLPETVIVEERRSLNSNGQCDDLAPFAPPDRWCFLSQSLCAGVMITILIYSGFLMNPRGIVDMASAFSPWMETGLKSGHEKPFFYWLKLMSTYEWSALAALAAAVLIAWRTSYCGRLWCVVAVGTVLAYSLIPYKTPWLILNLLWPLYFVFGYTIETIHQTWPVKGKVVAYAVAVLLVIAAAGTAARLNWRHFADPQEGYVYTHSHPSINDLVAHIERVCAVHPEAKNMNIIVATQQTWPLPWTLSDYTAVRYEGVKTGQTLHGDVFVVDIQDCPFFESHLEDSYYKVEGRLRDGYTDIVYYYRVARFQDTWQGAETLITPPISEWEPSS
jgi:uncharacterized protein (TIGR03663 family)